MHAWVMVMERLAVLLNRLYVISAISHARARLACPLAKCGAYLVVILHTKLLDSSLDGLSHSFLHNVMLARVIQLM
jgi:hypothetical protein